MMSKNPLVSVLMTAYNREKYIAEAIESVLASSFEDFELIIVDDCSKDRTVEIAKRYETDARVRVYLNEKNLGDYPNRNRAAELAKGKYLKYVDADDLIYGHGLQVMVESMEKFPDAGLGLAIHIQDTQRPHPFELSPTEAYEMHFFSLGIFSKSPLSAILRKDAFTKVGRFSGLRYNGDFEMWLKMGAQFSVVIMSSGVVWWRAHEEQETRYRSSEIAADSSRDYLLGLRSLSSSNCPLSREQRTLAIGSLKRGHSRRILRLALRSPQTAFSMCQKSHLNVIDLFYAFNSRKKRY